MMRTAANQEWALDFAHDAVACGRAIRVKQPRFVLLNYITHDAFSFLPFLRESVRARVKRDRREQLIRANFVIFASFSLSSEIVRRFRGIR